MDTLRLEEKLKDLIGSPVSIEDDRGELTINYGTGNNKYSVLDGILEKLGYRG